MICSHNPEGFKWIFSSLSKEFSKSFSETRHVPIDIKPDIGIPRNFVDFLSGIRTATSESESASSILNKMSEAFDAFAVQLHNELTINVFEALKILSEGIILDKSNGMALDEQTLEDIREPVFILLYRLIFILYAEDRSIFPIDNGTYYEEFSIKWLKKHRLLNPSKTKEYSVLDRLSKLFKLVELGSDDLGYDPDIFSMKSYYGRLFDRKIHADLDQWKIKNSYLLDAIGLLTRTRDKKGNSFFLDYSALETRHLGSVYEHLLEYHLTIKNKKISDLPDAKDRKSSGSYYTPQNIVDHVVENTVGPLIDDIIKNIPQEEQIDRILELNILDPAMGSGHFLIGVTNYIAKRICDIEYGEEATESMFIERKRDVVRRCIYGVDLNPLAVDLAQVSLWLETLSSERPLSFLSAHLKSGNSLIGSSLDQILNKQTTLMESTKGRAQFKKTIKDFIMLEQLEDDNASAVKTKTAKYQSIQSRGTVYHDLKFILDAHVAKDFGVDVPPMGDYIAKIGENSLDFYAEGSAWPEIKRVSDEHSFFHWDLEFADIFHDADGRRKKNPGFDAIVSNPPWDIVEPNIDDFFSSYNIDDGKKFSLLTKPQKNSTMKKLLKDSKIKNKWKKYLERTDTLQKFFKSSGMYNSQTPKTTMKKNKIKMNLYKFFTERYFQILKKHGIVGAVLPSGLYSDLGTNGLRTFIFENNKIISLNGFLNKKGIFPGIHRQFKFMNIICKKGSKTTRFKASFYIEDVRDLDDESKRLNYDVNLTKTLSPDVLSIIEFKKQIEVEIFKKMIDFPVLGKAGWGLDMQREFNTTDDAPLFNTQKNGVPVYEGKMINQFDHVFTEPRYWIDATKAKKIQLVREKTKISSIFKKNKMKPTNVNLSTLMDNFRLVWRLTTNATNTRTTICAILPPNVVTVNSLNYIVPEYFNGKKYVKTLTYEELLYLCAMLNSFIIDFGMRRKIASAINIFHMKEIRIPKFEYTSQFQQLSVYAGQLVCKTNEFNKIKDQLKINHSPSTDDEANNILIQINILAFKICNITKEEVEYVLASFPSVDDQFKQRIIDGYG